MSACMSGTRGSGVVFSTGDMLVRGFGGVCDMCMCLARGGVGGEGGEWKHQFWDFWSNKKQVFQTY